MSCYITMPNPCHTGVQRTRDPLTPGEGPRRENTYDNLVEYKIPVHFYLSKLLQ